MIYLLLLLVTGTWIAVIFKILNLKRVRAKLVICVSYMVGFVIMALNCLGMPGYVRENRAGKAALGFIVLIGMIMGLFMCINLLYTERSTETNGVGSTTFFNRIGFFPCIILTAVLWKEIPDIGQVLGLVLVIISLLEMVRSFQEVSVSRVSMILWLVGSTAMIELMNRIFSRYCEAKLKPLFLLAAFAAALAVSLGAGFREMKQGERISRKELLFGLVLGVPNSFNNFLKLKSLETLSATTVFATFAVGTMAFSIMIGAAAFGERVNKRTAAAIGMAAVSIILMNL